MKANLLLPVLLVMCSVATAQEVGSRMQEHEDNGELLEKFAFTEDMPTSKAFALYSLGIASLDQHLPGAGAEELAISLDIPIDEATLLAKAMIAARLAVAVSTESYVKQSMCSGESPAVFGKSAFAALQGSYSATRQAESRELQKVLDNLSPSTTQRLLNKLHKQKKRSAYYEVDYEKYYERKTRSVDVKIAELCIQTREEK